MKNNKAIIFFIKQAGSMYYPVKIGFDEKFGGLVSCPIVVDSAVKNW